MQNAIMANTNNVATKIIITISPQESVDGPRVQADNKKKCKTIKFFFLRFFFKKKN